MRTRTPAVSLRHKVVPVLGAALAWAGRELVAQLADYALYGLDRRLAGRQRPGTTRSRLGDDTQRPANGGRGPRHRRRHRGG